MSSADLSTHPDLSPLFGPLSQEANNRLLDRLAAIDARLHSLAAQATTHVGVGYRHLGLSLLVFPHYVDISGGPIGNAGDIWFEVRLAEDESGRSLMVPPWTVEARVCVYCSDQDPMAGGACLHDIIYFIDTTASAETAVDILETHVAGVSRELPTRAPAMFTHTRHADLP
jgi:hypothetical protein